MRNPPDNSVGLDNKRKDLIATPKKSKHDKKIEKRKELNQGK